MSVFVSQTPYLSLLSCLVTFCPNIAKCGYRFTGRKNRPPTFFKKGGGWEGRKNHWHTGFFSARETARNADQNHYFQTTTGPPDRSNNLAQWYDIHLADDSGHRPRGVKKTPKRKKKKLYKRDGVARTFSLRRPHQEGGAKLPAKREKLIVYESHKRWIESATRKFGRAQKCADLICDGPT